MAEYVSKEAAMDYGTLYDWYISSIDETIPPVWTGEHIEELLNDYLVIPKETPSADVRPEKHGRWELNTDNFTPAKRCSVCGYNKPEIACDCSPAKREPEHYCPNCGAKMDGEDGESNENHSDNP